MKKLMCDTGLMDTLKAIQPLPNLSVSPRVFINGIFLSPVVWLEGLDKKGSL